MKPFSFRIDSKTKDRLIDLHRIEATAGRWAVKAYLATREAELSLVQQFFTNSEMALLAGVVTQGEYDPAFMASADLLRAKIMTEAKKAEQERRQASLTALAGRIKDLSPSQIYFIQEEIFRRTSKNGGS